MKTQQNPMTPFLPSLRKTFVCAVFLISICSQRLFAQTYQTNGSALNNGSGLVRMTAASIGNQTASAWSTTKIDLTQSFDMSFDMFFGCDNGANGGDGMTFTFHNDPRALNAVGDGFGYLGVGGSAALSPALSIEFDTYDGTASGGSNELAADHIAIDINGNVNNTTNIFTGTSGSTTVQAIQGGRDLENCASNTTNYYTIRVRWTYISATSQTLQLDEEGVTTMTYSGNLINTIFAGSPLVYWGFTAATGSASNEQWIAPTGTVIPWQCASGSCCTAYTLTQTGPSTVCAGSISVGVTPSTGSAPSTYNWSTGVTTSSATITGPGAYTINTQQNQAGALCPGTLTFNITSTGATGVMTGGATICDDGTSTTPLNVALSGTSPFSITYSIDGVNQPAITGIATSPYVINAAAPHLYALTAVSDASACSNGSKSGTAQVKAYPSLPVGHDNTFSAPGSTSLSVDNAGGTYEWYTAATGGAPVFTGTNYTTPVLPATTTYYVKNAAITPTTNKSVGYLNNTQYGTGGNNTGIDNTGLPKAVLWLDFKPNSTFTLNTVNVDFNVAVAPQVAGSQITVYIDDLTNGALSRSISVPITGYSVGSPQSVLVNVAHSVIATHNYRISYEGAGSVKGIMYWDFVGPRGPWGTNPPATITKDPELNITTSGQGWYPGIFNWQITVTNPASSCGRTPVTAYASLPVRLLYFRALLKAPGIAALSWSTASEENNDYFTLQRSVDGIHFIDVAEIDGAGTSNTVNNYNYIDEQALSGISYYRVKQTDWDGKYTFSNMAKIDDTSLKTFSLNLSPNPSTSGSSIFLDLLGAEANSKIPIAIYDMLGRLIYSNVLTSDEAGSVHEDLGSLVYLSQGTYIISVAPANKTEYKQKVMIY
ncbi:MAG: T9SS type A sorting domain-containing protein [Cytophagaceae bacterium]|nr:T9SS type A sorting domain-containing protein [Cytophagaceae bacterium]